MDKEHERIEADLRGLVEGEVRCDDVFLQLYASDASIYEIRPLGVVRPRGLGDVIACVQYAAEREIPIHARGAGTGLAGESLGPGLVLDFSHSMRRILDRQENTIRVQPGVVLGVLNQYLAPFGRQFGPDPAVGAVSTIGSVVALDGSGSHWLRYGSARTHVEKLQLVMADGSVVEASRHPVENTTEGSVRRRELVGRLAQVVSREAEKIHQYQPKSLVNRCGYHLDVLENGQFDLAKLLVGSEGTLALITEATLRTSPLPRYQGVALLFFDRLESAAHGALAVSNMGVSACDLMDRRLLTIARESDVRFDVLLPKEAEAMLLIEFSGDDPQEVRDRLQQAVLRLRRRKKLAFDARATIDPEETALYWRLAQRMAPTLYRLKGTSRPLPFVEDIAVPPAVLPDFLVRMQNVLKEHQVTASLFAHAGHGQLHVRPFLDLSSPEDVRKMQQLASDLYEQVWDVGGTISGEHGDGLSRTCFVGRQYGPLVDVFREVKRIFDPRNIFNPGKVVADAPQPISKNLRPVTAASSNGEKERIPPLKLQLLWEEEDVTHAARNCNGCGGCRTQLPDQRMCPIFRFAPAEEASPRAKANLLRGVLTGRLDAAELAGEELKEVADLCVNCHQCRLECPASVDIPKLMQEVKAQYVATNGLRLTENLLTRLDSAASWFSLVAPLSNWAIRNRFMRWLAEKTLGIAQGRKLPRFASRSYLRRAQRRKLTRPTRGGGRKVLYFLGIYANWFDTQLADSFVRVLEHNGVSVYVHPIQQQSGMGLIASGAIDRARKVAARNVELLAEAVRQGYHIVATEPAAALCLKHEYLNILDDDDARLVAENSSEACTYLWKMHQTGKLELDFSPIHATLGYHLPCHLKALETGSPGEHLLGLIPGLTVRRIEKGCSGMASTFGLKRENYRSSLRAGWGLIQALRDSAIQAGATECSSCKIQMEQGTTKPTIHPIKMLALAYGLKPELGLLLTQQGEDLVVT